MEEYIDQLIANLKVIGAVPTGGRLAVRRGQLSVDSTVHGQCLARFWYGDSRETTLQHVRNTMTGSVRATESLMTSERPLHLKEVWALDRVACEMEASECGLRNLRSTYTGDAGVNAALHVVSERMQAHAAVMRCFIKEDAKRRERRLQQHGEAGHAIPSRLSLT
jgi:hypothetical protein